MCIRDRCIVAFSWWIVRLQRDLRFSQRLWQESAAGGSSQVRVDWPSKFLKSFGSALNIPVEVRGQNGQPCKIVSSPWVSLHLGFRVLSLKVLENSEVEVLTQLAIKDVKKQEKILQDSMDGKVSIRFFSAKLKGE